MFPDVKNGFRVQCVPKEGSSFANRKNLLWAGLRDEELSKASGIPGGVFVHVTGFIGGNLSKEGALREAPLPPRMVDAPSPNDIKGGASPIKPGRRLRATAG